MDKLLVVYEKISFFIYGFLLLNVFVYSKNKNKFFVIIACPATWFLVSVLVGLLQKQWFSNLVGHSYVCSAGDLAFLFHWKD